MAETKAPLSDHIAAALAAKEASELVAANIKKYIELHDIIAGSRIMALHQETLAQAGKISRVAAETAERNLRAFLKTTKE